MYLKRNRRLKDGKEHVYWNIVESKRCAGGKVVQRQVLYLGEINDGQRESWSRVIEAFERGRNGRPNWRCFPPIAPFRTMRKIKNHQLSWWFDGEPLKAVLKDSATFGMGLWDH